MAGEAKKKGGVRSPCRRSPYLTGGFLACYDGAVVCSSALLGEMGMMEDKERKRAKVRVRVRVSRQV